MSTLLVRKKALLRAASASPQPAGASVEYRYVRWTITKRKEVTTDGSVQFSEFELRFEGSTVAWDTATATNPGGINPGGEGPTEAIDGNTATKCLDDGFNPLNALTQTGTSVFVADAGVGDTFVFDGYRYGTAGDATRRDPISWTLEGSANGTDWTLLDTRADQSITDNRQTFTQDWGLQEVPVLWYGVLDYGSTNDSRYYTIPHDAALDIADGVGFAWGFFARVTANAGSNVQYVLSSGTTPTVPRFTIDLHEASDTQTPNQYQAITVDAGSDTADMATTSTPDADGVLRLIVFQYNGTSTWQLKFCTPGGTPTLEASDTEAAWDGLVAPTDWHVGARSDLASLRFWQNELGGLFRANRLLTDTEIQDIATGISPITTLGAACIEAWRFRNGAVASEVGIVQGIVATRQGSGWT